MKITLKTTKQVKKAGTKTVFITVEETTEQVTEQQHKNATCEDTCKWFRRLGGSETLTREYTCRGYLVTKLVSTSPDKEQRTIREYTFE
jgi:hypothetical protein